MSANERHKGTRGCFSCDPEAAKYRVEWAMWGNMNILYAAVCKSRENGRVVAIKGVLALLLMVLAMYWLAGRDGEDP